jgi:hypothetical protein
MPTIEQIRAKIRRNFPDQTQSDAQRQKLLTWDRETAVTIVSSCGRFRVSKFKNGETQKFEYSAFTTPGPGPSRKVAGPFDNPKQARDAVQDYVNGQPMQADLA